MRVSFPVVFYSLVRGFASSSPTIATRGEISNNPVAANFLRRAGHATVVLGNYLYIDGGEFSQMIDGSPDLGQGGPQPHPYCRQNNFTLSIDLKSSWTNTTVAISVVPKASAPILNRQVLWKTDANSCFSWAGEISGLVSQVPPQELWKFVSDSTGAGLWSQTAVSDSTFSKLLRRSGGSDPSVTNARPFPQSGAVAFNSSSNTWDNLTSVGLNTHGTILNSEVVIVPAFGLDGRDLLVVLGGQDPGITSDGSNVLLSLNNITIYDPYIDRWYAQSASGAIPAPRELFCAVAMQGDNGTYEIFLYGGVSTHSNENYADVYVLTIPGFAWFQVGRSGAPRFLHTCEVVGGRQLITVGGLDSVGLWWSNYSDLYQVPDPFTQGIGIFDMTALDWMPSYNANAAAYESPAVIKNWYAKGNQALVQWQSKEIARMFIRDSPVSVNPTPVATGSAASTSTPNIGNCNSDTKVLALTLTTSFLGLFVAAVPAWTGWKLYRQKRLKAIQSHLRNESPSPEENVIDAELPPTSHVSEAPLIPSIPQELRENQ